MSGFAENHLETINFFSKIKKLLNLRNTFWFVSLFSSYGYYPYVYFQFGCSNLRHIAGLSTKTLEDTLSALF